MNSKRTHC